jgi:sRNA-binding protein
MYQSEYKRYHNSYKKNAPRTLLSEYLGGQCHAEFVSTAKPATSKANERTYQERKQGTTAKMPLPTAEAKDGRYSRHDN